MLIRGAAKEQREMLLQTWVAADLLAKMRDALPQLVKDVCAPGAAARQHLVEMITVEQYEHRATGVRAGRDVSFRCG
jgi:hypothetical protein